MIGLSKESVCYAKKMDLQSNKMEIILLLEENGYSEKEIKHKQGSKRNLFVKTGCLHTIAFPYDPTINSIFIFYIIRGDFFPIEFKFSIQAMSDISSANRFIGLILEALVEIEKDIEKEVFKNTDIALFGAYSDTLDNPFYNSPFFHLPIEFWCESRSSLYKNYRFWFVIYYDNKSIVVKKYIDDEYVGILISYEV